MLKAPYIRDALYLLYKNQDIRHSFSAHRWSGYATHAFVWLEKDFPSPNPTRRFFPSHFLVGFLILAVSQTNTSNFLANLHLQPCFAQSPHNARTAAARQNFDNLAGQLHIPNENSLNEWRTAFKSVKDCFRKEVSM